MANRDGDGYGRDPRGIGLFRRLTLPSLAGEGPRAVAPGARRGSAGRTPSSRVPPRRYTVWCTPSARPPGAWPGQLGLIVDEAAVLLPVGESLFVEPVMG